jgi:hypothetical protein
MLQFHYNKKQEKEIHVKFSYQPIRTFKIFFITAENSALES